MYDAPNLKTLLYKGENSIKEIMSSTRALIYVLDEDSNTYFRFNEDNQKISHEIEKGLAGLTLRRKKI